MKMHSKFKTFSKGMKMKLAIENRVDATVENAVAPPIMAVAFAIISVLYAISVTLSVRFYETREF